MVDLVPILGLLIFIFGITHINFLEKTVYWMLKLTVGLCLLAVIYCIGLGIYSATDGGADGILIVLTWAYILIAFLFFAKHDIKDIPTNDQQARYFALKMEERDLGLSAGMALFSGVALYGLGRLILLTYGLI